MRPETRQALEQAQKQRYPERVAVITAYYLSGWDDYWPWPGPRWMQGRYQTWNDYQRWLLQYAGLAWGPPSRAEAALRELIAAQPIVRADAVDAEQLVRELAKYAPVLETAPTWHECALCNKSLVVDETDHDESCLWRRAREWVRRSDAARTEER